MVVRNVDNKYFSYDKVRMMLLTIASRSRILTLNQMLYIEVQHLGFVHHMVFRISDDECDAGDMSCVFAVYSNCECCSDRNVCMMLVNLSRYQNDTNK